MISKAQIKPAAKAAAIPGSAGEILRDVHDAAEPAFDYSAIEDLAERKFLRDRARSFRGLAQATLGGIVDIGRSLVEAKEKLPHGQFLRWIRMEFAWCERTARSFMDVYRRFKSANVADLKIDVSALYLLAAPSTPEPVRAEVLRRAEAGEKIPHRVARGAIDDYRAASEPGAPAETSLQIVSRQDPKQGEVETVSQAIEVLDAMNLEKTAAEIAGYPEAVRVRFWRKTDGAWEKLNALRGRAS